MKKKIKWENFTSNEIKIKMKEFEGYHSTIEGIITEYLDTLDEIDKEYIKAKQELIKRGEL